MQALFTNLNIVTILIVVCLIFLFFYLNLLNRVILLEHRIGRYSININKKARSISKLSSRFKNTIINILYPCFICLKPSTYIKRNRLIIENIFLLKLLYCLIFLILIMTIDLYFSIIPSITYLIIFGLLGYILPDIYVMIINSKR